MPCVDKRLSSSRSSCLARAVSMRSLLEAVRQLRTVFTDTSHRIPWVIDWNPNIRRDTLSEAMTFASGQARR